MRAALVRESDGLVTNVVEITFEMPSSPYMAPWVAPPGHVVVTAQRPDGTWRRVGPGCWYDRRRGTFVRPTLQVEAGHAVVRWLDEDDKPAAALSELVLEIDGTPHQVPRQRETKVGLAPGQPHRLRLRAPDYPVEIAAMEVNE